MKPDDKLLRKKKKKRSSRFARFIFIAVFIIAIFALIFYSIDNPDFLPSIKDRLIALYDSSEESTSSNSTGLSTVESGQESSESISALSADSGETTGSSVSEETVSENSTNKFLLLWRRIVDFFVQRASRDEEKLPDKLTIKVYFAGTGQEQKFVFEERTIFAGDPAVAVTNAVKELIKGPLKSYYFPVIPPGTELLDVEIYENLAKIDFSQDFLQNSLESGILDEYIIYTVVNTVTEIPDIDGVIFLIEGKRIQLYGRVDLSIPAIRNEEFLPEETDITQ